jgi:hypothetical protein
MGPSSRAAGAQPGPTCLAVPRPHRSYAARRRPASVGHHSGAPCGSLPRCGRWGGASWGPTTRGPAYVPGLGDGSPARRKAGMRRGQARAAQGTGPSSSCVLWSNTPPATAPSWPQFPQRAVVAFAAIPPARHPGKREVAGPPSHGPHVHLPPHRRTCCQKRRKVGYRRGRAPPGPGRIRPGSTMHEVAWGHRIRQCPSTHRAWSH